MLVTVNDKPVPVAAIVRDGRALLPLRVTAQSLGATVDYDPHTRLVTVYRHGLHVTVHPTFISGRAYMPLRFVAEWFGARVVYDPRTHVVHVTDPMQLAEYAPPASAFTTPPPVPPPTTNYPDYPGYPNGGYPNGAYPVVDGFSFYTENARAYYPGDWMHFVLIAPPGGTATMQLCNLGYSYTMQNWSGYSPNRYEVNVPAPNGYNVANCLVTAYYTAWNGRTFWIPVPLYIGLYTMPKPKPIVRPTPTPLPRRYEPTPTPSPRPTLHPTPHPTPVPTPVRTHGPIIAHTPQPETPAPKPTAKPTP